VPKDTETPERVVRPELPRTKPIRSWSTLFGPESAPARVGAVYNAGTQAASEAVQRGVELGYRVMDDYLRQGAAAAESFATRPRDTAPSYGDMSQMAERMLRSAQDFSSLWFDFMGTFVSMVPTQLAGGAASAPPSGARTDSHTTMQSVTSRGATPARVTVRVDAQCPSEVTLSLEGDKEPVLVEPLKAIGNGMALQAIIDVAGPSADLVRVHVVVPPGAPADRYTGALYDREGKAVGRLTVALLA